MGDVLIPSLEDIIAKSEEFGNGIEKEELKEVHNIYIENLRSHLEAEQAWLAGHQDEAISYYEESDQLYFEYEDELNKLASKWGVEIEWEDWEDQ